MLEINNLHVELEEGGKQILKGLDLKVEAGSDNTYLESVTAVKSTLVGNLALVASYTVKHNTDVPALTEKTDTYTALSLEYAF